jgi:hypothetical protein
MDTGQAFLLLETAATIFMAGVLWTMQLLNYPLLALVGAEAFPRYEAAHNRRFALVVVPGVLAAAAGGIGLAASRPSQVPAWAPACELALLVVVIISTAALQAASTGCSRAASTSRRSACWSAPTGYEWPPGRRRALSRCGCATRCSRHERAEHHAGSGRPPRDHGQRHRADPAARRTLSREGSE